MEDNRKVKYGTNGLDNGMTLNKLIDCTFKHNKKKGSLTLSQHQLKGETKWTYRTLGNHYQRITENMKRKQTSCLWR